LEANRLSVDKARESVNFLLADPMWDRGSGTVVARDNVLASVSFPQDKVESARASATVSALGNGQALANFLLVDLAREQLVAVGDCRAEELRNCPALAIDPTLAMVVSTSFLPEVRSPNGKAICRIDSRRAISWATACRIAIRFTRTGKIGTTIFTIITATGIMATGTARVVGGTICGATTRR
jgi:hypothetical protein